MILLKQLNMRKIFYLLFLFFPIISIAQTSQLAFIKAGKTELSSEPIRKFVDNGLSGMEITYKFQASDITEKIVKGVAYTDLHIKGFSHLKDVGKAALPSHNDLIAVPLNAKYSIEMLSANYTIAKDYLVFPALQPAVDTYGADEPEFEIDSQFYESDIIYPETPVSIVDVLTIRGMKIAVVQLRPVLYNPARRELRLYSEIKYRIVFTGGSKFVDTNSNSSLFLENYPSAFLNRESVVNEINLAGKENADRTTLQENRNYIIITHSDYLAAAEMLAQWKSQLGLSVEIVSHSTWTSALVMQEIHNRYTSWDPKPDYFVIIGDNQDVPGKAIQNFTSDLYYACMDGATDFTADMAYGRISVSSASQAEMVVLKIIDYEKFPVSNTNFYSNGLNCAYFQEASNGYAERRFAQTAEEVYQYMANTIGFNVIRQYFTESTVYPTNWNNGSYSAGEAIPAYLQKPNFAWDGNANEIISNINAGDLYVLHRDHGYEAGWGDPSFNNNNVASLTNGNLLPVVFSINCLTGKFVENECFCEKFLRQPHGGAVGVFGHAEVSYSGYNDALTFGLFDGIWASPGLIPNFTGSGSASNPSYTPHNPITTMGDVRNYGLLRMAETWDVNQYTNELFHYFGDPAMKIWTDIPTSISANNTDTIQCGFDTTLVISNSTCLDGLATFVVDEDLIASQQLVNGSATLNFDVIAGQIGIVTVSKDNFQPYIDTITILGDCPKAEFTIADSYLCLADSVTFFDNSTGTVLSYNWNFGVDAIPATANTAGPHTVYYLTAGDKEISLTLTGAGSSSSYSKTIYIDEDCKFYMPGSGISSSSLCSGKLFDDGGTGNYSDNTYGIFVIEPDGAASISLNFTSFNYEIGWDTLFIYDGDIFYNNLIGAYSGSNLPNGGTINSIYGSVTLIQKTDEAVNESGFELDWLCNYPNSPPIGNFIFSNNYSCTGNIDFIDISPNVPDTWLWNFGDGVSSTEQNPTHIYNNNGLFSVSLIVSNSFGSDTITQIDIITIDRPEIPVVQDTGICGEGEVEINALVSGTAYWYLDSVAGTWLDTGSTYLTPWLTQTTDYYVENVITPPSIYGGEYDNSGGGSIFTASVSHYLVFDCMNSCKLVSLKVYADGLANREIQLRDGSDNIIYSETFLIPDGESRIDLNWQLEPGLDYKLAGPESPYLFRNNDGTNYPYQIGDLVKIKHSSASSNPTAYYYYFYDWEVVDHDCISPREKMRINISHDVPLADFNYTVLDSVVNFTNTSSEMMSCIWHFGDGTSSELFNPTNTYLDGTYTVSLNALNTCGEDSISKQITVYTSIDDLAMNKDFRIFPNPTSGSLNIIFTGKAGSTVKLELSNLLGQVIWYDNIYDFMGTYNKKINIGSFNTGLYFIKITTNDNSFTGKVILQK